MSRKLKTILIVDDVEDIREGVGFILEDEGYQVLKAHNGEAALTAIESFRIDLMITDILMPDMDGIELVSVLKERNLDIPFIFVSGGGRQLDYASDYNYLEIAKNLTGSNAVLKKPFKPEELVQMVERLINS